MNREEHNKYHREYKRQHKEKIDLIRDRGDAKRLIKRYGDTVHEFIVDMKKELKK